MGNSNKKRAKLPSEITEEVSSKEELFQNEVVRPIIKTQSDLIKHHVLHQLELMKVNFSALNSLKKEKQLTSLIQQNQQFKRELIGIVIGQFEKDELSKYYVFQKEINRRIVQIIRNRMVDQLA
jgi:hypothetical protein